jgi:hypothetical protein
MKRARQILIGLFFVYLIANLLTLVWITHHELFPRFPETWANRLVDWYGARNADEVAELEGLVGLVLFTPPRRCHLFTFFPRVQKKTPVMWGACPSPPHRGQSRSRATGDDEATRQRFNAKAGSQPPRAA